MARLTACRRAIRRPHEDHRRLPVIFNDYMNTLMGDPTTERLLPLIAAAAEAGAEYFCIDSGWYAGLGEGWWDTVGAWRPSRDPVPGRDRRGARPHQGRRDGARPVARARGRRRQQPGRPAAARRRRSSSGTAQLVVEHGRYHLDLRHPAAVKHLDEVVDFLVGELGVGYLKFDYNISVGPGPDSGGLRPGAGLLAANRAQLDWLDAVLDRYPGLVIENCSSGGMRTDYALLSRLQLQSTSDQQEYLRYPPIAAAAPAAIAPEQAAVWAYPQPEFTDDEIAFTMVSAMLGRVHLSGHLDRMSRPQRELVAEAVRVYKESAPAGDRASVPFWPLGLPRWDDPWVALGLRAPDASYLAVWRRGPLAEASGHPAAPATTSAPTATDDPATTSAPTATDDPAVATLPIPRLRGRPLTARILYPSDAGAGIRWDARGRRALRLAPAHPVRLRPQPCALTPAVAATASSSTVGTDAEPTKEG